MSQKLSIITPTYHTFVKDQLLTHNDLNEVINYFDDQQRLSRICLSGVGIVCGFKLTKNADNTITLTQGSGITTDGDLVELLFSNDGEQGVVIAQDPPTGFKVTDSIHLTKFRDFTDSEANYLPFHPTAVPPQIALIELLPASATASDLTPASFDFTNRTLLLYIDCYSKDPGACTTISCDSQGAEQVHVVRVLVVNDDDLQYVNEYDYLFNNHNITEEYLSLIDVAVPRVLLNNGNTDTLDTLAADYHTAMIGSGLIGNLTTSLNIITTKVDYNASAMLIEIANIFSAGSLSNTYFQYRYDLLKDLVDSYNELRDLFIEEYPICCPDIYPFPKHLLLGKADGAELSEEENPNRHSFYPSPILNGRYSSRDHLISILKRMELMVADYAGNYTDSDNPIKITPSKLYTELGSRSIPFYYDPQYNAITGSSLVRLWDYKRRRLQQYNRILGYHQSSVSTISFVEEPLKYTLDPYNFYRIEGHQGLQYQDALETITTLKEENSLPFDVKVLGISVDETAEINVEDYACDFQDLDILLNAWGAEQTCTIGEVTYILSGFSTAVEGVNINEEAAVTLPAEISPAFEFSDVALVDPCVPDRFKPGNPVVNNLTLADDTLGKIVGKAMVDYKGKDSIALIAYIDQQIAQLPLETWQPISISATLSLPARILASCYSLTQLIPETIQDLDSESLIDYTNEINRLCTYTKQLQSAYADGSLVLSKNIMALVDLLNNQLTNICCSSKKLQALFQEVIDRKLEVLTRLKFSIFAEQHPGLEHLAGVQPGGTFVMVYVLDKDLTALGTGASIPTGTVVADFALPYLCCSDCSPINFIIPKSVVSLSLPTDVFCLGNEDGLFVFDVSPIDGVIEADGDYPGVYINGTELTIVAAEFDSTKFGIPIKFTVNQQYTNTYIIVRKKAVVDFTFTENVNVVAFTPTGEISNSTFFWDFGDGTTSTLSNPVHTYSMPLDGGATTVKVTLTVTPLSGACPVSVVHEVPIPDVTVTIDQTTFCLTADPYPFTIIPKDANPEITGTGVTKDRKFFDPRLTKGLTGPFKIKFNGNVIAVITVNQLPVARMTGTLTETSLDLVSQSIDASTYKWEFLDAKSGATLLNPVENEPASVLFSNFPNQINLQVVLTAGNDCGISQTSQVFLMPPL